MDYLIPEESKLVPINNKQVYYAVSASMRGGAVQVLNHAPKNDVHDADINSSYPHVMVSRRFATHMDDKICITARNYFE